MHPLEVDTTVVITECDPTQSLCRITIRPNASLSRRGRRLFFLGILLVSMAIALVFALQGAWMVFPFAGLEMLLLAVALHLIGRKTRCYEVVSIHPERVEVVRGDGRAEQVFTFQRYWARTGLYGRPPGGRHLYIHSHGVGVELGGFLNESERESLARELRRLIGAPGPAGSG